MEQSELTRINVEKNRKEGMTRYPGKEAQRLHGEEEKQFAREETRQGNLPEMKLRERGSRAIGQNKGLERSAREATKNSQGRMKTEGQ